MMNTKNTVYAGLITLFSILSQHAASEDVKPFSKNNFRPKTRTAGIIYMDPDKGNIIAGLDYLALDLTYNMMAEVDGLERCSIIAGLESIDSIAAERRIETTYNFRYRHIRCTVNMFGEGYTEDIETFTGTGRLVQHRMIFYLKDGTVLSEKTLLKKNIND